MCGYSMALILYLKYTIFMFYSYVWFINILLYRVARSRLTHFKFEYCAGAIVCCG